MNVARRFLRNERGAVVVDHIPVFFAVTIIVLITMELGIAHFLQLRAQKAVQLGARIAISLPPAIDAVPRFNEPVNPTGGQNIPCFSTTGPENCVNPGTFQCRGTGCSGNGGLTMARIVQEMQRVEPSIQTEDVTLTYVYRSLGNAGGPYTPEIVVNIGERSYDFAILSLGPGQEQVDPHPYMVNFVGDLQTHGATSFGSGIDETVLYSGIVASAFGESLFESATTTGASGS
ncbi:MAG: hypothetical protein AAFN51_02095 [Pseudomonadota bacterium]